MLHVACFIAVVIAVLVRLRCGRLGDGPLRRRRSVH